MIKQYYKDNSKTNFNFILQIKAVPLEVRKRYYYSTKWKNESKSQKRIALLEILERYFSQKIKPKWDDDAICRKLKLSKDSYFCLKSRLLKSLREEYFNPNQRKFKAKSSGDIVIRKIESARNMIELGMVREAKNTLYQTEKLILKENLNKENLNTDLIITLSEIYEYLIIYYHRQRNKARFNIIFKKLKELNSYSSKLDRKQKALLTIRNNIANAFSEIFLVRSSKSNEVALENYLNASVIAKKNNFTKHYLKMLFFAGNILHETGKIDLAVKTFQKGYNYSAANKLKSGKNIFHTKLMLLDFLKDNSKANEYMKTTEGYYEDAIKNPHDTDYTMHILFQYLRFTSFCGYGEKFRFLSNELVDKLFLYSRKADALFRWYAREADNYIEDMYQWHEHNGDIQVKVDEHILHAFEKFNYEALMQFSKFYSYDQLSFVYTTQIELEFWKGKKCNFENAFYYLNKMKRTVKKISSFYNASIINTFNVCLKISEESTYKKPDEVFVKYLPEIKTLFTNLQSKEKTYNPGNEYAFLYCASETLNSDKFRAMLKQYENLIRKNQPGVFEELLKNSNKNRNKKAL